MKRVSWLVLSAWMGLLSPGIGQQRLRELARATHLSMYHSPFEVYARNITNPDVFQSNEDKEKTSQQEWLEKLVTVERAINDKMVQTSFTPPSPATQIETFVMSGNAVDVDGLMSASVKNSMVEMEAAALRTLIGANNDGTTALQRIQNTGETMSLAHKSLMTTLGLVRKVVGAINFTATTVGGSIPGGLGNGIKGAANILKDAVEFASVNIVEATEAFADIARIFATVIPSMPYIFLILAAIGWFMQILQSMYGMTLFFIMHAIPQNTFIGSQQQGYITLLSLFFRPLLIVSGFFVSFALFEVGVDLVINSFVAIHATVQGQGDGVGGLFEVLTFLTTMKWWWYVLAATMMAMTYTIFGLTQELSDNTLDWLGTNLLRGFGNMNTAGVVSTAASNMKNRHDKIKLALDRAKPNQSPDPMGNIGGNPSPNQPNGGSGGQSLGTDLGVSKDGVLTTTTSSQNIDTSKGSLTKDVLLSARTQDGHRMFEESKYNRASDMVAKALSRQNNFANRLQIQGGLMGATVGAIGSAIGATYGFRNNGLTGALTGAKQGFGAKEVAHYRSIGEVADFHRTNQAFYGISSSGNTDVGINPMTTSGHIGSDNIGNMSNSIANDPSPSPAPTANNQADNMNTITPASPSINSQSITDLPMNASQPTPNGVIHTNAAHTNAHPTNIGNTARPSDLNTSNASQPHISQTSPTTERGEFDQNNISPNNDNAINGGGSMVSASAPTHTKPLDSSTFDNQATPAHQSITNNANNASSVGKTGSTTMADANILPTSARVDGEHHNTTNLPQNTLHNNRITMPSVDTASQPVHRGSDNIMSEGNPRTPSNHTVVSPLSHSNDIAFGTSQSNDNNVATPSNIVNQNQTTQATNTASDTPKNHQNFTSNRHQEQVINPPTQTAPISGRDYVLQEHKKDLESHHSVTHTDSKEIRDLNETITQPPNTKPNKDDQEE
ncbi:DotA/TraY family protein (plasmid) [Moraxella bovis]|uniref:DotA/TraY family protein n=1 Tax=Moraxella bovis TaxID=476 RepID=A0ABY6MAY5_MORBO|nr:DotA/TraY family protein [Moraxella bovis]UZA04768.1 DotA/TraY family protein [Moraxella bovis]